MIQKKWALLTLTSLPLVMAGCEAETLDDIAEATVEIDRITTDAIEELNLLIELEMELQDEFIATLETDEDLATIRDESSPIFENIAAREELLDDLQAVENELEVHQEVLATYEGEMIDLDDIAQVDSAVNEFEVNLDEFAEEYAINLANEREFFVLIAEEDASYDDFVEGIDTINEERASLVDPLVALDETIVVLNEELSDLQASIAEQTSDEE